MSTHFRASLSRLSCLICCLATYSSDLWNLVSESPEDEAWECELSFPASFTLSLWMLGWLSSSKGCNCFFYLELMAGIELILEFALAFADSLRELWPGLSSSNFFRPFMLRLSWLPFDWLSPVALPEDDSGRGADAVFCLSFEGSGVPWMLNDPVWSSSPPSLEKETIWSWSSSRESIKLLGSGLTRELLWLGGYDTRGFYFISLNIIIINLKI